MGRRQRKPKVRPRRNEKKETFSSVFIYLFPLAQRQDRIFELLDRHPKPQIESVRGSLVDTICNHYGRPYIPRKSGCQAFSANAFISLFRSFSPRREAAYEKDLKLSASCAFSTVCTFRRANVTAETTLRQANLPWGGERWESPRRGKGCKRLHVLLDTPFLLRSTLLRRSSKTKLEVRNSKFDLETRRAKQVRAQCIVPLRWFAK